MEGSDEARRELAIIGGLTLHNLAFNARANGGKLLFSAAIKMVTLYMGGYIRPKNR